MPLSRLQVIAGGHRLPYTVVCMSMHYKPVVALICQRQ